MDDFERDEQVPEPERSEDTGDRFADEPEGRPSDAWGRGPASLDAEQGGGVDVTPDGGIVPGAVPSQLPVSPAYRQMERDIRGDFPSRSPGPAGRSARGSACSRSSSRAS
jgi:hypothetical protein